MIQLQTIVAYDPTLTNGNVVTTVAGRAGAVTLGESDITGLVADLAAKLGTSRLISTGTGLSGGGDLSADRTIILANTPVTPGSYLAPTVTIDQQGRITAASLTGILPLSRGGLNLDLTATGGAGQFLKQATLGGAVTVVRPAVADLSDGSTGTGAVVLATAPTLATPTLGVAAATTINKVAITAPATSATLTIADGATLTASATATVSGTNTGDQTITLTGDVTGTGAGSFATTVAASAVTNAKLANMAATTIKGNSTGVGAAPSDLTATTVTSMLNALVGDSGAGGTKGLVPAPAAGDAAAGKVLGAGGGWVTVAGTGTVTSVGLSAPAELAVTGTPVTTTGTLALAWATQTTNKVLAAPNGSTGVPTFRALVAADVPTLNQSTTGSAATLTTPRAIYGNNFDGSAALAQIIASTYGGTGNGFTKFSGPATAEKTFTLPNASANVLTDNAAVTVAQGGTGVATLTAYAPLFGGTTTTGAVQSGTVGTAGQVLTSNGAGALPTFQAAAGGGPIVSVLSADGTSIANSTVMVSAGLSVTLAGGPSTYIIEGELMFYTAATPGVQVDFGSSSLGATWLNFDYLIREMSGGATLGGNNLTALTSATSATGGSGYYAVTIRGAIVVSTGGTLAARYSQFVSSPGATQIRKGSWLKATKQ